MTNNISPLKIYKFCPKCGSNKFEPKGFNLLICQECDFEMYINSAAATIAIIRNKAEEILFTERKFEPKKGKLDFPGGFVDICETAEKALKREVKEETNLEVESLNYLTSNTNEYFYSGITISVLDLVFQVQVKDFSKMKAADDVSKLFFTKPEDIDLDQMAFSSGTKLLKKIVQN